MNKKRFTFNIIAGSLKGRKLTAPDLGITRPPLSRLRKAIFDFLTPYLDSAEYLDLFSGSGSFLFEAVSRGVSTATGVEINDQLTRSINAQAEQFGVNEKLSCLKEDVFDCIERLDNLGCSYDLIMLAPPQYQSLVDRTVKALQNSSLLKPDGMIICQHDSSETDRIDFGDFEIEQQRKYGNSTFTILKNG